LLSCKLSMPKFGKKFEDTGYDGSQHWKVLHDEVNKIECDYCKEKGVKLMRGLHDSVNLHLGKKALHPKDLDFALKHIVWSKKQLEPGLKCELC